MPVPLHAHAPGADLFPRGSGPLCCDSPSVLEVACMVLPFSARLPIIRATLGLLYRSHPRAFVINAVASLAEPLFFPAVLFLLHQLFGALTGSHGAVQFTPAIIPLMLGLLAALLIQRLGVIVR